MTNAKTGIRFLSGYIKSIYDMDGKIKSEVDYAIDDGVLDNPPSKIVDLINGEKVIER